MREDAGNHEINDVHGNASRWLLIVLLLERNGSVFPQTKPVSIVYGQDEIPNHLPIAPKVLSSLWHYRTTPPSHRSEYAIFNKIIFNLILETYLYRSMIAAA